MTGLAILQRGVMETLRASRSPPIAIASQPTDHARWEVYVKSRRHRLLGVLRDDYPRVRASVGEAHFTALVDRYLEEAPPRSAALRNLGQAFPTFLSAQPGLGPSVSDLARLEWLWVEVFDAPNAEPVAREHLTRIAPRDWPGLRLELIAAHRVETFDHDVLGFDPDQPEARAVPGETTVLLWRKDYRVFVRELAPQEAALIAKINARVPFADLAESATASVQETAADLVHYLARWLQDGLVGAVHAPRGGQKEQGD